MVPLVLLFFTIDMLLFSIGPSQNKITFLKETLVTVVLEIWIYLVSSSMIWLISHFKNGFQSALTCGIYSVSATILCDQYWKEISDLSDFIWYLNFIAINWYLSFMNKNQIDWIYPRGIGNPSNKLFNLYFFVNSPFPASTIWYISFLWNWICDPGSY